MDSTHLTRHRRATLTSPGKHRLSDVTPWFCCPNEKVVHHLTSATRHRRRRIRPSPRRGLPSSRPGPSHRASRVPDDCRAGVNRCPGTTGRRRPGCGRGSGRRSTTSGPPPRPARAAQPHTVPAAARCTRAPPAPAASSTASSTPTKTNQATTRLTRPRPECDNRDVTVDDMRRSGIPPGQR
jgi:hypothetical protein